jgi:O-antigen/teichoic acid export membrane protein
MEKKKFRDNKNLEVSLKLLVKTSFIVFVGLVLSKIFTYLFKIIVARYYGPEIYGIFSLTFMIIGLFSAVFSLGITDGILRYIPLYRGKKENSKINFLIKFSSKFLFFAGIIGSLILFLSSEFIAINIFHNNLLIPFLQWSSVALFILIFFNFFLSILRAYEKISEYSFLLNILQPAINLAFLLLFIFLGTSNLSIVF